MILAARFRYWLPLLPLMALLAFVYWLDQQVQTEVVTVNSTVRHAPDGIMDNFHATTMNPQGVPHMLMSAARLRHYPDHDTTELDMPSVTLLSSEHPPVHIQGKYGNISSNGDEVVFHDNVGVLREAVGSQSAMTLNTEYLRILPNKDFASSDRAVTMVNAANTVHAVGMEMDNKARTLKLLSNVRSQHLPNVK